MKNLRLRTQTDVFFLKIEAKLEPSLLSKQNLYMLLMFSVCSMFKDTDPLRPMLPKVFRNLRL